MHKILVVDDDVIIIELLEKRLRYEGYEVVGKAYSGEEAVEMARLHRPDLILMDIVMPGKIDGITAAETINAELDIPVIFLTAFADDKSVERAKKVEPRGYILKPFQEKEIKAAIEVALYRKDLERQLREANEQLKREILERKRAEEALRKVHDKLEIRSRERTSELEKVNQALQAEIIERKQVEEELRESEGRLRSLFETMAEGLVLIAPEGHIVHANPMAEHIFGLTRSGIESRNYVSPAWGIICPDGTPMPPEEMAGTRAMKERHQVRDIVMGIKRSDGSITWITASATPLINVAGTLEGAVCTFGDITKHKQTEEQVMASLEEREVLLKEIHHQTKNNLQVISSLLDMHSRRAYDQQTVDLLKEARAKIHAMALIHSQLYQSDRFVQVDMGNYIHELVAHLSHVYANRKKSVTSDIECSDIYLTITQAIPCALVLHELTSNAFKHAFKDRQKGVIKIFMRGSIDAKIVMRVEDDGVGIPEEIDVYKTDTMGLKLVRNLVQEQLKGSITVKRDHGTKFSLEFENMKEEVKHA